MSKDQNNFNILGALSLQSKTSNNPIEVCRMKRFESIFAIAKNDFLVENSLCRHQILILAQISRFGCWRFGGVLLVSLNRGLCNQYCVFCYLICMLNTSEWLKHLSNLIKQLLLDSILKDVRPKASIRVCIFFFILFWTVGVCEGKDDISSDKKAAKGNLNCAIVWFE